VTITAPFAGSGQVKLASNRSEVVVVNPSVTLSAGRTSYEFLIRTTAVESPRVATLSATMVAGTFGVRQPLGTASLQLLPASPETGNVTSMMLSRIEFEPSGLDLGQSTSGVVVLNGVAPPGGYTVNLHVDAQAPVELSPRTVRIPAGQSRGAFTVKSRRLTVPVTATGPMGSGGSVAASVFLGPAGVKELTFPDTVLGGWIGAVEVKLDRDAPSSGLTVPIVIEEPQTPAGGPTATASAQQLTFPAGTYVSNFGLSTRAVARRTTVRISAGAGDARVSRVLVVRPPGMASLRVEPATLWPGMLARLTVDLEQPAGPGGLTVTISQDQTGYRPLVVVSPVLRFAEGTKTMTTEIRCDPVPNAAEVSVVATVNNVALRSKVKLLPSPQ
jgi:hypothetical protein